MTGTSKLISAIIDPLTSHESIGFRYWKNPGPFVQYRGIPGNTGTPDSPLSASAY